MISKLLKKIKTWYDIKKIIESAYISLPIEAIAIIGKREKSENHLIYFTNLISELNRALRIDPNSKRANRELLYIYNQCWQHKECIRLGDVVLHKYQFDKILILQANVIVGESYFYLQEYENAKNHFKKALAHRKTSGNGIESELQDSALEFMIKIGSIEKDNNPTA